MQKVQTAIDSFKPRKAPGLDGIQPRVLKALGPLMVFRLHNIIRGSYLLGTPPERWFHSKSIFLSKAGKPDYSKINAYRPINLASFQFKTMEKILQWDFIDNTLNKRPMHPTQHGFRPDMSTEKSSPIFSG